MKVSEAISRVRTLIGDEFAPYRWKETELRGHLQSALRRLNALAPHTRYVDGVLTDFTELPQGGNAEIAVDGAYDEAIVNYAGGLCYQKDAPDVLNAERANALLAQAERLMT